MTTKLTAIVVAYRSDALHDRFEDGSFATYDATELRIVSPEKHIGKLVVFHDKPVDETSPWKAIGTTLRFSLDSKLFPSQNTQIFNGAVEDLEIVKQPGKNGTVGAADQTQGRLKRELPKSTIGRRTLPDRKQRERKTLQRKVRDANTSGGMDNS